MRKLDYPDLDEAMDKWYDKYNADMYNADESGLFFKAQSKKIMQYKNMPANSVKINKER